MEVHVSVAGHHRILHREARLSAAEEQGWARAVFGPDWEDAGYSEPVAHYVLFLGPDRQPVPVGCPGLSRPVTPPA